MKKKILSILLAAIITISFASCLDSDNTKNDSNSSTSESSDAKSYVDLDSIGTIENKDGKSNVELNLLVEENIVFAKYSVDFIVDGKKIQTLTSSKTPEEIDLKLTNGEHKLRFEKTGDPKVFVETTETISKNQSFSYALKRHEDKIDLNPQIKVELNVTVETNIAMARYAVDFYVDLNQYTTLTDNNAGKPEKIVVLLDKGTHSFDFAKSDDYSIIASMKETFSEDTSFDVSIKRHKKKIEITSKKK